MKNNNKEVKLEFPLQGFDKNDIKVNLSKDRATISAEKKTHNKVQKKDFYHEEHTYRSFGYTTTLPQINPYKANIEFKNGILRISAPKKKKIKKKLIINN